MTPSVRQHLPASVGRRVRAARKAADLTQSQLAELLGITKQMVSHIECGRHSVTVNHVIKICGACHTSADYLLLGKEHGGSPQKPAAQILSENLRSLMDANKDLESQEAVGVKARINQRTVGRILNQEHFPQLNVLEAIAEAFELKPWQLLLPN